MNDGRPPRIVDTQPVLIAGAVRALPQRGARHLKTILRRMEFLRARFLDRLEADGLVAHQDAKEYGAIAWLLERAGLVEPLETSSESQVAE